MLRNGESGAVLGSDRFIPKKASGDAGFRRVHHPGKTPGRIAVIVTDKAAGGAGFGGRDPATGYARIGDPGDRGSEFGAKEGAFHARVLYPGRFLTI